MTTHITWSMLSDLAHSLLIHHAVKLLDLVLVSLVTEMLDELVHYVIVKLFALLPLTNRLKCAITDYVSSTSKPVPKVLMMANRLSL